MADPKAIEKLTPLLPKLTQTNPIDNVAHGDLSGDDLSGIALTGVSFGMSAKYEYAPIKGRSNPHHIMRGKPLVNLRGANFSGSWLPSVNFRNCRLENVDFRGASLHFADFTGALINGANFEGAISYQTQWCDLDLTDAIGIEGIVHHAPSHVDIRTLTKSSGRIPPRFLQGCGFNAWQQELVKLFDPNLTANQISNFLTVDLFSARTDGPLYLGGAFLSYSTADRKFVDKLQSSLEQKKISCWRDSHDLVSGPLETQVFEAIRMQDVVILVLSKNSIESDWVEAELEKARDREKQENRNILCPISLDDSWKEKVQTSVIWRTIKAKHILDFSLWTTNAFSSQFDKLTSGLSQYYVSE